MTKDLIHSITEELCRKRPLCLVSVAFSSGSTPREAGAMMAVGTNGLLGGTIGGGLLEHRCLEEAENILAGAENSSAGLKKAPSGNDPLCGFMRTFVLDNHTAGGLGMVCGGTAKILFTPLLSRSLSVFEKAEQLLLQGRQCFLVLPLDGSADIRCEDKKPAALQTEPEVSSRPYVPETTAVFSEGGASFLFVPLSLAGRVFLLGGGHVAAELAFLLDRLEFPYLAADDRPEFSGKARFPGALAALTVPFDAGKLCQALNGPLTPCKTDAFCIMTRGHEGDTEALRFALSTPASYIGVMGSRRKRDAVFSLLEKEGFSQVRNRVTTPIGLDIGARTPAEIAVSIAAQLTAWRRGNFPFSIR